MSGAMAARRALFVTLAVLACPLPGSAQVVDCYHLDGLGSVRAVTNQAGLVIEHHDYLPWGEEHAAGLSCPNGPGTCQPLEFTGKERDAETGQDYFGARYYRSTVARFAAVDPIHNWNDSLKDPQRWNRYAYVSGNPLKYVDPDGREQTVIVDGKTYMGGVDGMSAGDEQARNQVFNALVTTVSLATTGAAGYAAGGARLAAKEVLLEVVETVTGVPVTALPTRAGGRTGRQFRGPDPAAEGRPHSRFRSDSGGVAHYETYGDPTPELGKRVDVVGPAHGGVPTPHVVDTRRHTNPHDPAKSRIVEGKPRPASSAEVPRRKD